LHYSVSPTSTSTRRQVVSFGRGVEIETLHFAFQKYAQAGSRWFAPVAGDYCSLAVSQTLFPLAISVASKRLKDLAILGALTGLQVIYGIAPQPFGPGFLQYLLNNLEFGSLTSEFVLEWYPELHHTIRDWVALTPSDNNLDRFQSHFVSYHGAEVRTSYAKIYSQTWLTLFCSKVAAYYDRDKAHQDIIGVEMLYRAVVGPAQPNHPELQAFFEGFRLPCENGFSTIRVSCILTIQSLLI